MFYLRSVSASDLNDLYELSKMVTFINLPPDKKIIKKKIAHSLKSFEKSSKSDFAQNHFIFVLEDKDSGKVIGVSMIHSQHGTDDEPHFFLKVSQEYKYSQTINTGFIHGTLKLGYETNGPTEIGGLVLHPDYRSHQERLGKQISFVRFLYMGLNPENFKEEVHSELMPPLDEHGNSPLWEAIGRRFLNMNYNDADVLSRNNKEFILSLVPSESIYLALLPMEARDAIGKVGDDTKPVKKMLEAVGFKYINEVDPFDGGPHYRAKLKEIESIKSLMKVEIHPIDSLSEDETDEYMVQLPSTKHKFFSAKVTGYLEEKKTSTKLFVLKEEFKKLGPKRPFKTSIIEFN